MKFVWTHMALHPHYPFRVNITKITIFCKVRPLLQVIFKMCAQTQTQNKTTLLLQYYKHSIKLFSRPSFQPYYDISVGLCN